MVETKGSSYSAILGKLKRGMGTRPESVVTEAKRGLADNVVLVFRTGTNGEEIRKQIDSIVEGERVRITRGNRAVEVRIEDQETTKEEILGALEDALGKKRKVQVL